MCQAALSFTEAHAREKAVCFRKLHQLFSVGDILTVGFKVLTGQNESSVRGRKMHQEFQGFI